MSTNREPSFFSPEDCLLFNVLTIQELEEDKAKLEEEVKVKKATIAQLLDDTKKAEKDFKKGIQLGKQACRERDLIVTEYKKLQELHAKQVKKSRDTWREHVLKIEALDDVVDDQTERITGLEFKLMRKDEEIKKLKQERVHDE